VRQADRQKTGLTVPEDVLPFENREERNSPSPVSCQFVFEIMKTRGHSQFSKLSGRFVEKSYPEEKSAKSKS
jgi:hypothetical protein